MRSQVVGKLEALASSTLDVAPKWEYERIVRPSETIFVFRRSNTPSFDTRGSLVLHSKEDLEEWESILKLLVDNKKLKEHMKEA
jgi:hypothetical protein